MGVVLGMLNEEARATIGHESHRTEGAGALLDYASPEF
jgi:hypothetical protein